MTRALGWQLRGRGFDSHHPHNNLNMKKITLFPVQCTDDLHRVKLGIDPTSDRLHLGHLAPLRIAKQLQERGKHLTLVLGTFTAQMGDPSGRDKARPILDSDEVKKNGEKLLEQASKVLVEGFDVFRNADVFESMSVSELMSLVSKFTLKRITSRDAFQKRIKEDQPISIQELIVPVLQGFDSVTLRSEIEIGGTDQLFNFQLTRELQQAHGQEPEVCIMTPILSGTDGRKMSKSLGNCIFFDETPENMFGLCMSVSDEVMDDEFIPILTDLLDLEESPIKRKMQMAFSIVEQIHGVSAAKDAQNHFESTIQKRQLPQDIKTTNLKDIIEIIKEVRECSGSEAARLIKGGGVKIDGKKAEERCEVNKGVIIKVGKRDFVEVV